MTRQDCPFCSVAAERVFFANRLVLGIWDGFPVSPGHALLVPKRHAESWDDVTREERVALIEALSEAMAAIRAEHEPDGFNFGINAGAAAGQTVPHMHLHVIPRYSGDVPDPRGGVRGVIPRLANYRGDAAASAEAFSMLAAAPHERSLVTGDEDHLLPHLLAHLDHARAVDMAIAFVMSSGVESIASRLEEVLGRGGRVRLLTGDYFDITDPDALLRLLDLRELELPGQLELRVFETRGAAFHPKAYIFDGDEEGSIAFVGSSNLSRGALTHGVEWNYRVISTGDPDQFREVAAAYEELFEHGATRAVDHAWVDAYRKRRRQRPPAAAPTPGSTPSGPSDYPPVPQPEPDLSALAETPESAPTPHPVQEEALAALRETRAQGYRAGLVVLATGLGKTWLSAFDSVGNGYERVLFVAHRDEILGQAIQTYRKIAPGAHLGRFTGSEKVPDADVVFASIQTLSRTPNLEVIRPRRVRLHRGGRVPPCSGAHLSQGARLLRAALPARPHRHARAHRRRRPAGALPGEFGVPPRRHRRHPGRAAGSVPLLRRAG